MHIKGIYILCTVKSKLQNDKIFIVKISNCSKGDFIFYL